MADLTEEQKTFIVTRLAYRDAPAQIVRDLRDQFDVLVTYQQVYGYDPTKEANSDRVSKELREVFATAREAFDKQIETHAAAHLAYRVGRLQRMSERAEALGNWGLAAQLLEQIAKESGGTYTNKRKLEIEDPKAALADLLGVSPEQLSSGDEEHGTEP